VESAEDMFSAFAFKFSANNNITAVDSFLIALLI
jgi:hypothetical protein